MKTPKAEYTEPTTPTPFALDLEILKIRYPLIFSYADGYPDEEETKAFQDYVTLMYQHHLNKEKKDNANPTTISTQ